MKTLRNKASSRIVLAVAMLLGMASVSWGQSYWKNLELDSGQCSQLGPMITESDGSLLVASQFGNMFKINTSGNIIWEKQFSTTISAMLGPLADGGYLVLGDSISSSPSCGVLKMTPDGVRIWKKTYKFSSTQGYSMCSAPNGNFIIAGTVADSAEQFIELLRINQVGDTIWTRKYGRPNSNNQASAIVAASDGNFVVAGVTYPDSFNFPSGAEMYLLKIGINGDTFWTRTIGGTSRTAANQIVSAPNGNLIVAGILGPPAYGSFLGYVLEMNLNGDTVWTRTLDSTEIDAISISPTTDGNFMLAGGISVRKISPVGTLFWSVLFDSTVPNYWPTSFAKTIDGNFILTASHGFSSASGGCITGYLYSIIDDKYAYKNFPFRFKIPVSKDSLTYSYSPLRMPTGMSVSLGGTISWTPATDSVFMDHVEIAVRNGTSIQDTLTFNIFVNSQAVPNRVVNPSNATTDASKEYGISITHISSYVSFSLPVKTATLGIYDIHGRLVAKLPVENGAAVWRGTGASGNPVSAGRYFAQVMNGKQNTTKAFVLVR